MKIGSKVKFRNGEICVIKSITPPYSKSFITCKPNFQTIEVKSGSLETIVLEFDDGEITIASRDEFKLISPPPSQDIKLAQKD